MTMRQYTAAERLTFEKHENEQRREEASKPFSQRLDFVFEANKLAFMLLDNNKVRHLLDDYTLYPLAQRTERPEGADSR
jgi:hypothetical protein